MNTLTKIAATFALMLGLATATSQAALPSKQQSIMTDASSVTATVSLSQQRMILRVIDSEGFTQSYVWKVSTGKSGFETPSGAYKPTWLSINHKSKTYDNAPMPFAVFFTGGYAIHATDAVARLGNTASHGCVRLAKENAAMFFNLVETNGKLKTSIVVTQ